MEEAKNKKLSYEELSKAAGELHMQYQKLANEYQKVVAELNNRRFDQTAFFLQMSFKVVEHPEMYAEEFVKWTIAHIEDALTTYAVTVLGDGGDAEADKETKETEKADEAE